MLKIMRALLIGVAIAALAIGVSPANCVPRQAVTPSGMPDTVFENMDAATLQGKIASACMDSGWAIVSTTSGQVVCEAHMRMMQSVLTQALIGNSYSTAPRQFIRISFAQIGANCRAQANSWVETQMAFGQVRQQPYTDDNSYNNLLGFLMRAGGKLPSGTTFPYYAYVGATVVGHEPRTIDGKTFEGFQLGAVEAGSPGAQAGVASGDVMTEVNGKPFKTDDEYRKLMAKVAIGQPFTVTVLRAGAPLKLTMVARTRPPIP